MNRQIITKCEREREREKEMKRDGEDLLFVSTIKLIKVNKNYTKFQLDSKKAVKNIDNRITAFAMSCQQFGTI